MPTAIVTINGRRARVTGPTRELVQSKIEELTGGIASTQTHQMPDGSVMAGATHTPGPEPKRKASLADLISIGGATMARDQGEILTKGLMNTPGSAIQYAKDVGSALVNLPQTLKGVGQVAMGGFEKLIPARQGNEDAFDAVVGMYTKKYGSLESARDEALKNPVGFLSDIAAVAGISGGALKLAGKVGRLPAASQAGAQIANLGNKLEPLAQVTGTAGKSLSKVDDIRPFAGAVDESAIAASARTGIDLPASAISSNRGVALAESMVGKGFFGKELIDKLADTERRITRYADDLVSGTRGAADPSVAGRNISNALDLYHNNYIANKNKLYSQAKIGKDIIVDPVKTRSVVDAILKDKEMAARLLGSAEDSKYFSSLKKRLSGKPKTETSAILDKTGRQLTRDIPPEPITGAELKSAINELNEKLKNINDPLVTGNKAKMRKLVATMAEDLDDAIIAQKPELKEALTVANEFYKQGLNKLNSSYGKTIQKLADAGQYDKIVPAIMKPSTSADDIPRIMEIVGEAGKADIQASLLEEVFKQARSGDNFSPLGINRQLKKYGYDKLSMIFNEEQMQALSDIDKLMQSIGKSRGIMAGSQTAFNARIWSELGTLLVNPLLGAKLLLGDFAVSKFLSSPTGQRFLTTGIKAPKAIKSTGRLIMKTAEKAKGKEPFVRQAGIVSQELNN